MATTTLGTKGDKMKRKALHTPIILIIMTCLSCASLGVNLNTPEKKYLAARSELNLLLEQYIQIQDTVKDTDHKRAKHAFKSADAALDVWEPNAVDPDYNYSQNLQQWITAKNVILQILRSH